jgi:hypothetical protein
MSGTPTEAELRTQLTNSIAVLERLRAFVDGSTFALAGGAFDVLEQSLEGTYTPSIAGAIFSTRSLVSEALSASAARAYIDPILFDYASLIGFGGAYSDARSLMLALYEHFHANTLTVESRAITYDTSATAGGTNVGNGAMSRLTVDQYGYNLEACHVETKRFRCRRDQNNGALENAEEFEMQGATAGPDNVLVPIYGSGLQVFIRSHHAGTGSGGSRLNNSSFDSYSATAANSFTSWVASGAGALAIDQDTTNYYRSNPTGATNGSLRMTGGSGTITLAQTLRAMRQRDINPDVPYFLRVMVNKSIGTAVGGTVVLRMGASSASISVGSLSSGWNELLIAPGTGCWPRVFNESGMTVEVEWTSPTSGTLLFDDMIFSEWDNIDGTYWFLRGNHATPVAWLIDDTLAFTDTGGAPATAKVQYWLWLSGLGYLPSTTGTPTVTEPS